MSRSWADPDVIRRILTECETWAVVGLSTNTDRAAYAVARFLQDRGKRVVPIHPSASTVHGEQGYANLADVPFAIDCVDVFVRSELACQVAREAVQVGTKAVWFQLGVVDPEAFTETTGAGLAMVMDRCPAIEWPRHFAA